MRLKNIYLGEKEKENFISYICKNEYEYFLSKDRVVGVGRGYKIKRGFSTNEQCIKVFVREKVSINQLSARDCIPVLYKGIKVDVVESGIVKEISLKGKIRPTLGGYSIGALNDREVVGTLGCLVQSGSDIYILSNNHIIAGLNKLPKGSLIIQPGYTDSTTPKDDVVATLSNFIPIKFEEFFRKPENFADCAIAKVINNSIASPKIALIGKAPEGAAVPRLRKKVKKVGRTSELTKGEILSVDTTQEIQHITGIALYKNQIVTTEMAGAGDSGSVLLDENNYVLGLIGGSSETITTVNPIHYILKKLNVKLVTR